jgi:DNA processing protein
MNMSQACEQCLRRSWLLGCLRVRLSYRSRDREQLLALLELNDEQLIQAIAGRRRGELTERWERFAADELERAPGSEQVCRHAPGYPRALASWAGGPAMLWVRGGVKRLQELTSRPVVAIAGDRRASDYGMEMARSLARGLAASGVTVVSGFGDAIATAAQAGALEADGATVSVMAGGVDVFTPTRRRGLYEQTQRKGCAVAELPCGTQAPRWGWLAGARTMAGLAELAIVIEAEESPHELVAARVAKALGRTVAALPGRVTSPLSRGTCALLMEGAPLVRGPADALDLLYDTEATAPADRQMGLEPRLRATLEQVGAGRDTPGRLTAADEDAGETLLALAELELMGLLARGDGGRYVPRDSLAGG